MTLFRSHHLGLGLALVLAACGGAAQVAKSPESPAAAPSSAPTPTIAAPASTGTGVSTASAAPTSFGNNKPIIASNLMAGLAEAGIDIKNLPPLEKLSKPQQTKVMNSFKKSLGVDCKFCHVATNFEADHPMKNVAKRMWNEYVRGITFDGGALYCDSCHQGKAEPLDKSDKKVLGAWMDAEYTKRMKRNGQAQTCATCHGEPFNPEFIESWKKK
jgi:Cytochrome c7 and related cytochrome c